MSKRHTFTIMALIKGDFRFCDDACMERSGLFADWPRNVSGRRDDAITLTAAELWARGYRSITCDGCGAIHELDEPAYPAMRAGMDFWRASDDEW